MKYLFLAILLAFFGCATLGPPSLSLEAENQLVAVCPAGPIFRDGYNLNETSNDAYEKVVLKDRNYKPLVTLYFKEGNLLGGIVHIDNDKKMSAEEIKSRFSSLCDLLLKDV